MIYDKYKTWYWYWYEVSIHMTSPQVQYQTSISTRLLPQVICDWHVLQYKHSIGISVSCTQVAANIIPIEDGSELLLCKRSEPADLAGSHYRPPL